MCSYLIIYPAFPILLPPATKLGQGYVFTRVCDSVHSWWGGVCLIACWDTPPRDQRQAPPEPGTPPTPVHAGRYGQQGGNMHPTGIQSCYRPQQSCGQGYVFTRVCDSVHRGVSGQPPPRTWQGDPPDQADTPPPGPGKEPPPWSRQTPPEPGRENPPADQADTPPRPGPPREEDFSIRSMSGRYASYWNAFLFYLCSLPLYSEIIYQ